MAAAGIDLGGTKIEVRVFDKDWQEIGRQRLTTPDTYDDLLGAIAALVAYADDVAGAPTSVGVGTAGVVDGRAGSVYAINLPLTGHAFRSDLQAALGRPVPLLNDGEAMVLSEAVFGAATGANSVAGVILGTGLGGGFVRGKAVVQGALGVGGEIGHVAAPAHVVADSGLPIFTCKCGLRGCLETYVSGPGLSRIAAHVLGQDMSPHEVTQARHGAAAPVWQIWCAMMADLVRSLAFMVDPDVVVLAGGLSRIDGLIEDMRAAGAGRTFDGIAPVDLVVAKGGDASGALGAAYAATAKGTALGPMEKTT